MASDMGWSLAPHRLSERFNGHSTCLIIILIIILESWFKCLETDKLHNTSNDLQIVRHGEHWREHSATSITSFLSRVCSKWIKSWFGFKCNLTSFNVREATVWAPNGFDHRNMAGNLRCAAGNQRIRNRETNQERNQERNREKNLER